jgi:hypothetical protein
MRVLSSWVCAVVVGAGIVGMQARGAEEIPPPAEPQPDKTPYNLFNPTPREFLRDMSTDRPDTTESPYTVDAGHLQLEMSFVDFVYDRRNKEREKTHSITAAPFLLKIGLLNNVDLQLGLDSYSWTHVNDRRANRSSEIDGVGDTLVRLKINLWGNDGGDTALAVMPFVTLPTGHGEVGAAACEGGVIVPLSIALPADFDLGLMAEFDFNRSRADNRYVVDFVHTATLSHSIIGELSGYVEYAGFANLNHDVGYRGYFDTGLTFKLTPDIQLDCGVRVGLTKAADDLGMFTGISWRY